MPGSPFFHDKFHDALEHVRCFELARDLARARIYELVFVVVLQRFHEFVGDGDRDIEIRQHAVFFLHLDEIHDFRVRAVENAHVGAPPRPALFHGFGGDVEHAHEGERAR